MKKALILLFLAAFVFPARQVNAQIIDNNGDFFVVSGEKISPRLTVKRLMPKKKKFSFESLKTEEIKKRMRKEPTGIPGDTLTVIEFFVGQITFKSNQVDPIIVPGQKVQMLPDDFHIFEEYLSDHAGESCYIIAPSVKSRYGFWKSGGTLNLVTNYGVLTPGDSLYQVNESNDERQFGYIPLERVVVYPMLMQRWTGIFGSSNPISVYQTGIVICDSTSKTVDGDKVYGIRLSTDIVSSDKEDFFLEKQKSPSKIEYDKMLFVEDNDSPILSDDSPYNGNHYEERDEHSREVNYPYTIRMIHVSPKKEVKADSLASKGAYVPDVVSVPVVSVTSDTAASIKKSEEVKPVAEKVAIDDVGLSYSMSAMTTTGATATVTWKSVPGATKYVVRFIYGDGKYNTRTVLPPAKLSAAFKYVQARESCTIEFSAYDAEGRLIIAGELKFMNS